MKTNTELAAQPDELDKKIAESDRLFAIRQAERAARQKALRIAYHQKALRDAQAPTRKNIP